MSDNAIIAKKSYEKTKQNFYKTVRVSSTDSFHCLALFYPLEVPAYVFGVKKRASCTILADPRIVGNNGT